MIIKYTCAEGYEHTIGMTTSSIELQHTLKEAKKEGAKEVTNPETGEVFNLYQEEYEKEKKKLEKDHKTLPHQYSYPTFQLKELQKKYNITS